MSIRRLKSRQGKKKMRILSKPKTEQRMNNQQMNKEMGVQGSHSPRQRSKVELTKSKAGGLYESDLPGDKQGKGRSKPYRVWIPGGGHLSLREEAEIPPGKEAPPTLTDTEAKGTFSVGSSLLILIICMLKSSPLHSRPGAVCHLQTLVTVVC